MSIAKPVQRILLPTQPSEAQLQAGRYPKRKVEWRGLVLRIENEAGSFRRGRKPDGAEWETLMHFAYGEVARTEGVDGDAVDVFLGPYMDTSDKVYVVHQRKVGAWDEYDEDKCMLGFESEADAVAAFLSSYDDPRFLGPITAMSVDEFIAKAKATREKPTMIKSVILLSKSLVGAYIRGGRPVRGYDNRRLAHAAAQGQGDLFGAKVEAPMASAAPAPAPEAQKPSVAGAYGQTPPMVSGSVGAQSYMIGNGTVQPYAAASPLTPNGFLEYTVEGAGSDVRKVSNARIERDGNGFVLLTNFSGSTIGRHAMSATPTTESVDFQTGFDEAIRRGKRAGESRLLDGKSGSWTDGYRSGLRALRDEPAEEVRDYAATLRTPKPEPRIMLPKGPTSPAAEKARATRERRQKILSALGDGWKVGPGEQGIRDFYKRTVPYGDGKREIGVFLERGKFYVGYHGPRGRAGFQYADTIEDAKALADKLSVPPAQETPGAETHQSLADQNRAHADAKMAEWKEHLKAGRKREAADALGEAKEHGALWVHHTNAARRGLDLKS